MTDPMSLDEAREKFPPIWTIYERPTDHPLHFVVRMWFGETPDPRAGLCATLDIARELVLDAGGSVRLARAPTDAPCIVESWI
jgi:hypothetical protein